MSETIIFYDPKSSVASVLGVFGKMAMLGLPVLIVSLIGADTLGPAWLVTLVCIVLGIILMIASEKWIAPITGRKAEYVFEENKVTIQSEHGKSSFQLSELQDLRAFEVGGDPSVKHICFLCPDGTKHDIFETWVTRNTGSAFDQVYRRLEGSGN